VHVTEKTIRNALHRHGLHARSPQKAPLLKKSLFEVCYTTFRKACELLGKCSLHKIFLAILKDTILKYYTPCLEEKWLSL